METVLSAIVLVFSSYDENQRILFANKFLSIAMWDSNSKVFSTLIQVQTARLVVRRITSIWPICTGVSHVERLWC